MRGAVEAVRDDEAVDDREGWCKYEFEFEFEVEVEVGRVGERERERWD